MTEPGFRDAIEAGMRIQRESYASGEPARMMDEFFHQARRRKQLARIACEWAVRTTASSP